MKKEKENRVICIQDKKAHTIVFVMMHSADEFH